MFNQLKSGFYRAYESRARDRRSQDDDDPGEGEDGSQHPHVSPTEPHNEAMI